MGYWGWRPLVLYVFMSVWVIGCTGTRDSATPSPSTVTPPSTLDVRRPATLTPTSTPGLPIITTLRSSTQPVRTLTATFPPLTSASPYPDPMPPLTTRLVTPSPTCYAQLDGSVLCLGEITNSSQSGLSQVAVRVNLVDRRGDLLRSQDVLLAQRHVPAGAHAPYHALFPPESHEDLSSAFGGVAVDPLRAEPAPPDVAAPVVTSSVGSKVQGRYLVMGLLTNRYADTLVAVRVVATLYDAAGRVTGYRAEDRPPLSAGETAPFSLAIVPQDRSEPYTYALHVEARTDR